MPRQVDLPSQVSLTHDPNNQLTVSAAQIRNFFPTKFGTTSTPAQVVPWLTDIEELINTILQALGLGAVSGPLDRMLADLLTALLDIPQGNITGLLSALEDLAAQIEQVINSILNGLGLPDVVGPFDGMLSSLEQAFADLMSGNLAGIANQLAQAVTDAVEAVVNGILDALGLSSVTGPVDDMITALSNALKDIPQGNVSGLLASLAQATDDLELVVNAILNALGLQGIEGPIDSMIGSLESALRALSIESGSALRSQSLINAANLFGQLPSWLFGNVPMSAISQVQTNLLINPQFSSAAAMVGGGVWDWDGSTFITSDDSTDAPGSASAVADGSDKVLVSNSFNVASGYDQTVSIQVEVLASGLAGSGTGLVQIGVLPTSDGVVGSFVKVASSGIPSGSSSDWTKAPAGSSTVVLAGDYLVPAGVTSAQMQIVLSAGATGGKVWVDNASAVLTGGLLVHLVDDNNKATAAFSLLLSTAYTDVTTVSDWPTLLSDLEAAWTAYVTTMSTLTTDEYVTFTQLLDTIFHINPTTGLVNAAGVAGLSDLQSGFTADRDAFSQLMIDVTAAITSHPGNVSATIAAMQTAWNTYLAAENAIHATESVDIIDIVGALLGLTPTQLQNMQGLVTDLNSGNAALGTFLGKVWTDIETDGYNLSQIMTDVETDWQTYLSTITSLASNERIKFSDLLSGVFHTDPTSGLLKPGSLPTGWQSLGTDLHTLLNDVLAVVGMSDGSGNPAHIQADLQRVLNDILVSPPTVPTLPTTAAIPPGSVTGLPATVTAASTAHNWWTDLLAELGIPATGSAGSAAGSNISTLNSQTINLTSSGVLPSDYVSIRAGSDPTLFGFSNTMVNKTTLLATNGQLPAATGLSGSVLGSQVQVSPVGSLSTDLNTYATSVFGKLYAGSGATNVNAYPGLNQLLPSTLMGSATFTGNGVTQSTDGLNGLTFNTPGWYSFVISFQFVLDAIGYSASCMLLDGSGNVFLEGHAYGNPQGSFMAPTLQCVGLVDIPTAPVTYYPGFSLVCGSGAYVPFNASAGPGRLYISATKLK